MAGRTHAFTRERGTEGYARKVTTTSFAGGCVHCYKKMGSQLPVAEVPVQTGSAAAALFSRIGGKEGVRMTLGETIQSRRSALSLLQEKLAELVGVSRQAVSKWELGVSQS